MYNEKFMIIFYTYMWLRANATPYYVGKGKGQRAFSEDHGVKCPKSRARIIIQFWSSEQEAFDMEKFYIRLFGRKDNGTGILRNLTDGGEGTSGLKQSDGFCQKQSIRLRGNAYHLGAKDSNETLERKRKARLGKPRINKNGTPWHMPLSANELISKKKIGIRSSTATEFKLGVKHGPNCTHCTMIRESMNGRARDAHGHFIKAVQS